MAQRILLSILILISILFFPLWVSVIFALFGIIYFEVFWEAVLLFFISDLLFGVKETRFFDITIVSTVFTAIVLILAEFTKKKLKFYKK